MADRHIETERHIEEIVELSKEEMEDVHGERSTPTMEGEHLE